MSASTDTKVYDRTTASSRLPTVTGLLGSDTLTGLTQAFADRNVLGAGASTLVVQNGYVLADGNGGANYALTVNVAAGTITPRPLSATGITAQSKVYDATTAAALSTTSVQVTGVLAGDVSSINIVIGANVTGTFADANVGTGKAVTFAGISLGGDATTLANYTLGSINTLGATAAVTPAPLTITGVATTSTYSAVAQTNALASVSGLVGSETVTVSGYGTGRNVGTYADALTVTAGAGTSLSNYAITKTNGALTITPFQFFFGPNGGVGPRIVGAANDKVYDAFAAATGTLSVLGLLGADVLTATASSSTFDTKDAGSGKTVTFGGIAVHGDATTLANYTLGGTTTVTTTAAVTPAPRREQ